MKVKKLLAGIIASAACVATTSIAASASALIKVENPEPGLSSGTDLWSIQLYNDGSSDKQQAPVDYGIDYSAVTGVRFTVTVPEKDADGVDGNRDFWDGRTGGSAVLSINGGDIKQGTDEWDTYNWPSKSYWGIYDEELDINTLNDSNSISYEKVGDYTYQLTANGFTNPLANGVAKKIGRMELCLQEWGSTIANLEVIKCEALDESGNALLTFKGNGLLVDKAAGGVNDSELCVTQVRDDGTLAVTGYTGNPVDLEIPEEINGLKVTAIDHVAFKECTTLKSITIPNSVTSIGDYAFSGCTRLTNITIPNSVTSIGWHAFEGCTSLTSITIPDGVTEIGWNAFEGCTSLTSITIPDSVTEIGNMAFGGCTSLTEIKVATDNSSYASVNGVLYDKDKTTVICYPTGKKDKSYKIIAGVTEIGYEAFENNTSLTSVTIPSSVTNIGSYAFSGCISLTGITIPDGVTCIGRYAFSGCTGLASITIPNSVTNICRGAFSYCTSLTSINILDGVTNIEESGFEGCKSLIDITIPGSVTSIGRWAFYGCTSLASVTIPDSVTGIGDEAFGYYWEENNGYYIKNDKFKIIYTKNTAGHIYAVENGFTDETCLITEELSDGTLIIDQYAGNDKKYVIPAKIGGKSVTAIDDNAFICCDKLESVTIPNDVTEIGRNAFSGCTSLASITIPDSVAKIGECAFEGCTSLKNVVIPAGTTYIGDHAFGFYEYIHGGNNERWRKVDGFKINYTKNTYGHHYATMNGFSDETCVVTEELEDGTIRIAKFASATSEYTIPSVMNGKKVTEIGQNAFSYCTQLTRVTIPDSVTKIGCEAFYECRSLKSITIPKNVNSIDGRAFAYIGPFGERVDNFKIYCYSGTTGEQYAKKWNYDYELLADEPTLAKVSGVKLAGRAADALRINWTKNTSADGYIVEMYQGNKWVRVAKITNSNTTTFRKAGLKASTVYKFRVRAYKMSGKTAVYSDYSATVAARTNPSAVKGAKLTGRAADALRINWAKNASADGYIVEMYQGNKWVRVAKITSNSTTTFRKAGLKASTVYKFRVRAYKMSGKTALYGNFSATVTARTNPSIVKGVKIAGKAKDALRVNWAKNASAQGYIVEMYKGGKWVRVAKITNGNTTTFRKAGLAKNTAYKFRVRAYHMSGKTALYGNYGSVSGKTLVK